MHRITHFLLFILCCIARSGAVKAISSPPALTINEVGQLADDSFRSDSAMAAGRRRSVRRDVDHFPHGTGTGCTCETISSDVCKLKCSKPVIEENRCSAAESLTHCKDKSIMYGCLDNKISERYRQAFNECIPVGRPVFSVNVVTTESKLEVELNWLEPPGVRGSVVTGYMLQMFSPPDAISRPPGTPCACIHIPPCIRSFSFSRVYRQNVVLQSQFSQCLDWMSATDTKSYRFRLIALPISHDGNLTRTSTWGEMKVKSCQEYDELGLMSHLGPLCRAKLKLLPPKWSTVKVRYKLVNHTIGVYWSAPKSVVPIQSYEAEVLEPYTGVVGRKVIVRDKLLPNATSYVFGMTFKAETTYTVRLIANVFVNYSDPSLGIESLFHEAYSDGEIHSQLESLDEDLNRGQSTHSFMVHFGQDGGWSPWGKWTCVCGMNKTQTRRRTCSLPQPGNGGFWCNGTSVEREECSGQCPEVTLNQVKQGTAAQWYKKSTDSAESHSARGKAAEWFKQPIFYVTLSTGFLVLLLVAVIVIKLTQRRRQRRSGARQPLLTSVQGESSANSLSVPRCIPINGPGSLVIYLENDFRPPDIDLIAAYDDNTNCNNSSMAHEVEPILSSAAKQTTVFISYARFSDIHDKNVLDFASWLARLGLNVFLDKWDTIGLGADIAGWTERKLLSADKVVVVLSSEYYFDWYSMEGQSGDEERCPDRQACLEAKLIQALIMEGRCTNRVCVPVFLGPAYDRACIPAILENSVWFRLLEDDVAAARHFLYYLCGVEEHQRPDIGGLTERAVSSDSILI